MSVRIVSIILVALGMVCVCQAFKCYECKPNADCHTEYESTDCDSGVTTCYHLPISSGQHSVKRGCGSAGSSVPHQTTLYCNEELCNKSNQIKLSFSLLSIVALFIAKMFY